MSTFAAYIVTSSVVLLLPILYNFSQLRDKSAKLEFDVTRISVILLIFSLSIVYNFFILGRSEYGTPTDDDDDEISDDAETSDNSKKNTGCKLTQDWKRGLGWGIIFGDNDNYFDTDDPNSCINKDPIRTFMNMIHILIMWVLLVMIVINLALLKNKEIAGKSMEICYNTSISFMYISIITTAVNYMNILFRDKNDEGGCDIYTPTRTYNRLIRNIYLLMVYSVIIYIMLCFSKEKSTNKYANILPIIPLLSLGYFWILDNISTTVTDLSINDNEEPTNDWLISIEDYINIVLDSSACVSKDEHSDGYCANKDSDGKSDKREYCDKIDEKDKLERSKCTDDSCKWVNINDNDCSGLTNSSCKNHDGCILETSTTQGEELCTGWCLAMGWIFSTIKFIILLILVNFFYKLTEYIILEKITTNSIYSLSTFKSIISFQNPLYKVKTVLIMSFFIIILLPFIFQIISTKCENKKLINQSRSLSCTLSRYGGLEGMFMLIIINILIFKPEFKD